jgi:urease accessory protein
MIHVENVLGNVKDPAWAARLAEATTDWIELDQWSAQKSRLRAMTQEGIEVAISLQRGSHLRDGDILVWQAAERRVIATRLRLTDVLVLRLDPRLVCSPIDLARSCVELGHALGNQHWPAVIKDTRIYVPMAVERKVMAAIMDTQLLDGVSYEFVPGADVIPHLAPHEARRLFGGAG